MAEGKYDYADWQEWRRFRAWQLYQDGMLQRKIAEVLDVSEGAVSQWINRAKKRGPEALRAKTGAGRPPELDRDKVPKLLEMLDQGAQAYGFKGEVWTTQRVAEVIEQEFGVSYHPDHVGKLLHEWGWTPQMPEGKARQQDEEQVKHFTDEVWPLVKKNTRPNRRPLSS